MKPIIDSYIIEKRIQQGHNGVKPRPYISIVHETYIGTKYKAKFIDEVFGEWIAIVEKVVKGGEHKRRRWDEYKLTIEEIENRLSKRPWIKIKPETYINCATKARFIDEEFGEFESLPRDVIKGGNHPLRSRWTPAEFEQEIKKTRPWISLDHSTFKSTKEKAKFIDEEFGGWWATPSELLCRVTYNHPNRYIKKLRLTTDATFVDSKYGEFSVFPNNIFKGVGHPTRSCSRLEQKFMKITGLSRFNMIPGHLNINVKPDFMLTDNIFIDVDGLYWHSELNTDKMHFERRELFERHNARLLQFREDEIENKPEIVASTVRHLIGKSEFKIYARKCKLVTNIDHKFFENNHLMGSASGQSVGLEFDGKLMAAMSYMIKGGELHIVRFCNTINTVVSGGFNRMLTYIVNKHLFKGTIINFVDLRYGNGSHLLSKGFVLERITLGWKWTDGKNTFNRLRCRANMDSRRLSEKEHAKELKWYKIYDAGQAKFVKLIN